MMAQSKFDGFHRNHQTNTKGAFILKRQSLTIHDGCVDVKKIPIIIRVMFQVLSFFQDRYQTRFLCQKNLTSDKLG